MSLMIQGKLQHDWFDKVSEQGEYVRKDSQFRNWITVDGGAGPSGEGGFKAEPGRYHLYVSYACPWAHRTLIFRQLKQLHKLIDFSVVHPHMGEPGWSFHDYPAATGDQLNGFEYLHQVYSQVQPDYTGIITVPVLFDKQQQTIVNNESSEIIRMLNSAFDAYSDYGVNSEIDMYPAALRKEIDDINRFVYDNVNNGVYRVGFATTQAAYEKNFEQLFAALDELDARLGKQRYLVGKQLTEADWRLFVTLLRFDAVYVGHFKCNKKRIIDYPNLSNYLLELYQWPGIALTINMQHIKQHYYYSHDMINPTRIVPLGPEQDFMQMHNREILPC